MTADGLLGGSLNGVETVDVYFALLACFVLFSFVLDYCPEDSSTSTPESLFHFLIIFPAENFLVLLYLIQISSL